MLETKRRIIARVITWRIGGIFLMVSVSWWIYSDPTVGLVVGIPYMIIRTITQVGHEFIWSKWVKWGKKYV